MRATMEPLNPLKYGEKLFCVWVDGLPAPKGSKRIYNGRLVEVSPRLKDWDKCLDFALKQTVPPFNDGATRVELRFLLPRPKTAKRVWPTVTPDIDKLARAVLDGLTRWQYVEDDSQIVCLEAQKQYCSGEQMPGVWVEGWRM